MACCWSRKKKRLRALAEWSFGGGERYCEACAQACPDCPARLNRPTTFEGWQLWDLVGRLGGQLRVLPGAVIGWDMSAALAIADAVGVPPFAMAELLPVIEAVMVAKLNEQIGSQGAGKFVDKERKRDRDRTALFLLTILEGSSPHLALPRYHETEVQKLLRPYTTVRAQNLPLASAVLLNEDAEDARLLLEEKETINRQERQSRQRHLERLNAGSAQTFGSSNLHLETLRALKDFNSLIASVAYPILQRTGQLRDSRLIQFPRGQAWEQPDQT